MRDLSSRLVELYIMIINVHYCKIEEKVKKKQIYRLLYYSDSVWCILILIIAILSTVKSIQFRIQYRSNNTHREKSPITRWNIGTGRIRLTLELIA